MTFMAASISDYVDSKDKPYENLFSTWEVEPASRVCHLLLISPLVQATFPTPRYGILVSEA